MTTSRIDKDAIEFGIHVKQGGWRLGLLVARNVVKAPGRVPIETLAPKTNATIFAEKSGTSAARVLRYLKAWDDAALDGYVPESALLVPGEELDGLETLPEWSDFYDSNRVQAGTETLERFTTAAEAEGTTTRTAIQIAKNKKAITAAIMADPEVEKVAREAVIRKEDQRMAAAARKKITDKKPVDDGTLSQREIDEADAQFDSLIVKLRAMRRTGQEALTLALDIKGFDQNAKRALVSESVDGLRTLLDAIAEAADGRSMDDELQSILSEGN